MTGDKPEGYGPGRNCATCYFSERYDPYTWCTFGIDLGECKTSWGRYDVLNNLGRHVFPFFICKMYRPISS